MSKPFQISILTVLCLVALRLVIGGHFFSQGLEKLEPGFTSAPFLIQAKGPLADSFQSVLPDYHRWHRLMAVPLEDRPNPHPVGSDEWRAQREASYNAWQNQVLSNWARYKESAKQHFAFIQEQQDRADNTFDLYENALKTYLDEQAEELAAYRHDLFRLEKLKNSPTAEEVPFQSQRVAEKRRETFAQATAIKEEVRRMESGFHRDLRLLADDEQYAAAGDISSPATSLDRLNSVVTWVVLGVGACLIVGLFTRLAAVVGALFLLSVIATQPFWVPDAAPTANQAVEMVALLVLASSHVGRWGGLDFFIHSLLVAPFRSSKET